MISSLLSIIYRVTHKGRDFYNDLSFIKYDDLKVKIGLLPWVMVFHMIYLMIWLGGKELWTHNLEKQTK